MSILTWGRRLIIKEQNDKAKYYHYTIKRENGTPSQDHVQEMEHLSSDMEHQQNQEQQQIQWRRDKIQELCSKGYSQREISQALQVGLATVNRDFQNLLHFILNSHTNKPFKQLRLITNVINDNNNGLRKPSDFVIIIGGSFHISPSKTVGYAGPDGQIIRLYSQGANYQVKVSNIKEAEIKKLHCFGSCLYYQLFIWLSKPIGTWWNVSNRRDDMYYNA